MKGKIFNAQEVQAIISGNKTQFREVIKPYPVLSDDKSYWEFEGVRWAGEKSSYAKNFGDNARPEIPDLCPYQVGQKIFCKESFDPEMECENEDDLDFRVRKCLAFKADFYPEDLCLGKWKPAQHMKQEHSRLTLQIKSIGVERLQDITLGDVIKEGTSIIGGWDSEDIVFDRFQEAWNATHKKPEEKFDANPWVWKIKFEIINN